MTTTRYPMNTYGSWLKAINPQEWLAATRDQYGVIWFTAAQFWKYLPECENYGVLRATYFINQEQEKITTISFYREIAHPALCCRWYHISLLENVAIDISEPIGSMSYARRLAMVVEAASLETTSDYRTLKSYCICHLLSHVERLRPQIQQTEFMQTWISEYSKAAVRRMQILATNRQEAINSFLVIPNLMKIEK